MILAVIQSALVLGIGLLAYYLILRKNKMFMFNRFFLMSSLLCSVLIPLLPGFSLNSMLGVPTFSGGNIIIQEYGNLENYLPELQNVAGNNASEWSMKEIFMWVYGIVSFVFGARMIWSLSRLIHRIRKHPLVTEAEAMKAVVLPKGGKWKTHSFFNYLFIPSEEWEYVRSNPAILMHEQAHAREKHSLDLLITELVLVCMWFNPFIWIFKHAIREVHEFLADDFASTQMENEDEYARSILHSMQVQKQVPLASGFSYLSLKNRIKMLYQSKISNRKKAVRMSVSLMSLAVIIMVSAAFKPATQTKLISSDLQPKKEEVRSKSSMLFGLPIKKDQIKNVSSPFGLRTNPITQQQQAHTGIDLIAGKGTQILAAQEGTVVVAEYSENYGHHIRIRHSNGFETMYAHLESISVEKGQQIDQYKEIGIIGTSGKSTGIHLHFEVIKDEVKVNPEDYFAEKLRN